MIEVEKVEIKRGTTEVICMICWAVIQVPTYRDENKVWHMPPVACKACFLKPRIDL